MEGRIKQFGDTNPTVNKLNRLGKIKVGEKASNSAGVEYPKALDYFIAKGKYEAKFKEAFGDKPTTIGIVFVSDNYVDSCNERFELRDNKGALVGKGDGINFELWSTKEGKFEPLVVTSQKDMDNVEKFADRFKKEKYKAEWRITLTLQFIIPKIKDVLGVWVFETKAKASTIPNIRSVFDFVQQRAKTIVSIPFDLTIEKVKSQKPGETKTYPVVSLIPNISEDKIDDIRAYLGAGNSVFDVKQLLEKKDPIKEIGTGEPSKQIEKTDGKLF